MAKLKSFEQFLSEMDRTEEVQQDVVATAEPVEQSEEKAEEVQGNGDAIEEAVNASGYIKAGKLGYNDQFLGRRSLSWTLSVDLGLKASDEFVGPWLGFDHVSLYAIGKKGGTILDDALTGKYTYDELKAAAADFLGIKESEEVIEDEIAENIEVVTESGEEAGLPAEDLKDETEVVDNDCETPEDKSDELEAELEDTVDAAGNEEISEAEETEEVAEEETEEVAEAEETEEVAEEETEEVAEEEEEVRLVSDMLKEVYESCKNEAKAWEDDAHDEHTVETYMKENAALVGALAAQSLKEMKEDYSVEAYEAACNEMIESYSKKVNEMKESDSAVGEETPEA
jgi:hypothetical protein